MQIAPNLIKGTWPDHRTTQQLHDLGQNWLTSSRFFDDASSSDHSSEISSASNHFFESAYASCNFACASDHSFGSTRDHNLPLKIPPFLLSQSPFLQA
jgi:hypothetical protein